MSMTTVPEPLSAGLLMMSCRRIRRFRARLSRLVKSSRTLVGFALRPELLLYCVAPGCGVHVDLARKGLGLS